MSVEVNMSYSCNSNRLDHCSLGDTTVVVEDQKSMLLRGCQSSQLDPFLAAPEVGGVRAQQEKGLAQVTAGAKLIADDRYDVYQCHTANNETS